MSIYTYPNLYTLFSYVYSVWTPDELRFITIVYLKYNKSTYIRTLSHTHHTLTHANELPKDQQTIRTIRFLTREENLNAKEVKKKNKERKKRRKKNKSFNLFFYESTNWFDWSKIVSFPLVWDDGRWRMHERARAIYQPTHTHHIRITQLSLWCVKCTSSHRKYHRSEL